MQSFTQPSFWAAYRQLPKHVQRQARAAYHLFSANPRHPSLQFKRVSQRRPVYSVRINIDCRALGILADEDIVWFWIGPHHAYERLLKRS